jgi:hypothetical protein
MLALAAKFLRQIVPPVIATLIAAVLIAGFNRAFSTHLTQPRMAALHAETDASERLRATPVAGTAAPAAEFVTAPMIERSGEKGGIREAAKEAKGQIRIAEAAPTPTPVRRTERVAEMREPRQAEPRQVEPYLMPAPVAAAPIVPVSAAPIMAPVAAAPSVRQEPVSAEPPMVTVPDRPRPLPQTQTGEPAALQQSPIGMIVNTLKPSSLFARAREFGEKIEAAGNEILPSIRQ